MLNFLASQIFKSCRIWYVLLCTHFTFITPQNCTFVLTHQSFSLLSTNPNVRRSFDLLKCKRCEICTLLSTKFRFHIILRGNVISSGVLSLKAISLKIQKHEFGVLLPKKSSIFPGLTEHFVVS